MDYTTFESYPIEISGINESYNNEIAAIELFVTTEIAYTGDNDDLVELLPYFVFFRFCEARQSVVDARSGESKSVTEFTEKAQYKQIRAWNIGVEKLNSLCLLNTTTANCIYRTEIGLF